MVRHWISYSVDQDTRRRRRRGRRWQWPWNRSRGPRYGRPNVVRIRPARQGIRYSDGERRRIWPWLLPVLLIPLFLVILVPFLLDDSEPSGSAVQTNGGNQPGAAADPVPGDMVPPVAPALPADDGVSAMVSVPGRPAFRLGHDAKFMDLGDNSCHDQRYVLITDGKAIPIEDLDEATVDALTRSDVPIDTVALGPGSDIGALRTIASRTGGAFTKME